MSRRLRVSNVVVEFGRRRSPSWRARHVARAVLVIGAATMSTQRLPSPNLRQSLETVRRRRAHLIAGACVVAVLYTVLVLFVRIAVL